MKFKSYKLRFSLWFKLTTSISIIIAFIMIIGGIAFIQFQGLKQINERKQDAEYLTEYTARTSAFYIEKYSYYMLNENATQLQDYYRGENKILSVLIFDRHGAQLTPFGYPPSMIDIDRKYLYKVVKDCIYQQEGQRSKVVGTVQIVFSLKSVYEKMDTYKKWYVFWLIATIVFINIILSILIRRMVSKPLLKLVSITQEIANRNFDIDFKNKNHDEIGYLSTQIEKMADELKNSFNEIQNTSRKLEKMVQSRTMELNKANYSFKKTNEQLMKDLLMARRIQEGIIPDAETMPKIPEIQFAMKYMSMESIGGDLFDVIPVTAGVYAVLVADVSGHGVPAALVSSIAKVLFNTYAVKADSPKSVCQKVNQNLIKLIGDIDYYYLTAFFGMIYLNTNYFEFTSAAHIPILHYRKKTDKVEELDVQGDVIGWLPDAQFTNSSVHLEYQDKILLYTDGITETAGPDGEQYGLNRLKNLFERVSHKECFEIVDLIIKEINLFSGHSVITDDRSILCFEYFGRTESERSGISNSNEISFEID